MDGDEEALHVAIETTLTRLIGDCLDEHVMPPFGASADRDGAKRSAVRARARGLRSGCERERREESVGEIENFVAREMRAMIVSHRSVSGGAFGKNGLVPGVDLLERLCGILPELQRERPVAGNHELQICGVRARCLTGSEAVPRLSRVVLGVSVDDPLAAFDRLRGALVAHADLEQSLLA